MSDPNSSFLHLPVFASFQFMHFSYTCNHIVPTLQVKEAAEHCLLDCKSALREQVSVIIVQFMHASDMCIRVKLKTL
jgi:hypothetical protein